MSTLAEVLPLPFAAMIPIEEPDTDPNDPPVREPEPDVPPAHEPDPEPLPEYDPDPQPDDPDADDPAIREPGPDDGGELMHEDAVPVDVSITEAHAEEEASAAPDAAVDAPATDAVPVDVSITEARQEEAASGVDTAASNAQRKAMIEAVIYVTDEPLSAQQIAHALSEPLPVVVAALAELVQECGQPHRGLTVREVAGGYKMGTKPEHHEAIRAFVKNLKSPLKLSMAALETLAVIAYKQPMTAPEIQEIRGVQGAGVLKTLLDRKLITTAGRKNVVGKPILYRTTKDFLVQFGLRDLSELPTLKEFEELRRLALADLEPEPRLEDRPMEENRAQDGA